MSINGIKFDSEGGFTTPSGLHVPVEKIKMVQTDMVKLAREFGSFAYGIEANATREERFASLDRESKWTRMDRANLCRIAQASEELLRHFKDFRLQIMDIIRDFSLILQAPANEVRERKKAEKELLKRDRAEKKARRKT